MSSLQPALQRCHLIEKTQRVRERALSLLSEQKVQDFPCSSLTPLGLGLLESARLFTALATSQNEGLLKPLFDGGESKGPNIDTRLRYIRDLFSASAFGIRELSQGSPESSEAVVGKAETPGVQVWVEVIAPHSVGTETENLTELARLLDELLEAVLCISENLLGITGKDAPVHWNEVYRHVTHIRDHFDYAQDAIIECIQPA